MINMNKVYLLKNMGCLIGIDYGEKRTGLAYTDPNKIIATGLKHLNKRRDQISWSLFRKS